MSTILIVSGILLLCAPAYALDTEPMVSPGVNPALDQALKGEGGVQIYMDKDGNVGTVTDMGPAHRTFSLQPPQSASFNIGPPLQLHNKSLSFPLNVPPPAASDRAPASTR